MSQRTRATHSAAFVFGCLALFWAALFVAALLLRWSLS